MSVAHCRRARGGSAREVQNGKLVLKRIATAIVAILFAGAVLVGCAPDKAKARAYAAGTGTEYSRSLALGTNDVVIGETNIVVNGTITATSIVGTLTDTNKADKSYVDNATNGLMSASAIDSYYMYPVFELSLGGPWTDFEIKASTNNFASLVYFYMSSATNDIADDMSPLTYFVDDYASDVRKWVSAPPHVPIATLITNPLTEVETVVFMPSNTGTWMRKSNTKLVWSYARYGAIGYETNATGTTSHWQPIRPQSWENARTVID
jgi:hypothetical protein